MTTIEVITLARGVHTPDFGFRAKRENEPVAG